MTDTLITLKAKIETEVAALNTTIRTSLRHARAIGEYLMEAKAALKGEEKGFVAWVKGNCSFSYPSAANYMKIAKEWGRFDEETLAQFTLREFLSAVAERAPRKKTPAVQSDTNSATDGTVRPSLGLAVVPVSEGEEDGRGDAVGVLEYDRCPNHEVASRPSDPQTPTGEHESALAVMPIRATTTTAVAPPASTTEDRVESVARELDIPADKLRAALVRHGFLSPAEHL